jgi:hypothetical protein
LLLDAAPRAIPREAALRVGQNLRATSLHVAAVAMGQRGAQTSCEVASTVLLDDSFDTIVRAIAEGRQLFRNWRLSFAYLLMVHGPLSLRRPSSPSWESRCSICLPTSCGSNSSFTQLRSWRFRNCRETAAAGSVRNPRLGCKGDALGPSLTPRKPVLSLDR